MRDRDQANEDRPDSSRRRFICPTCKRPVDSGPEGSTGLPRFFPFCSERCRLIDLGAWLDADYRIPAKPDEESEEAMGEGPSSDQEDLPE